MKIKVKYIASEYTEYVWVKPVPKPESSGHKALKNEDFIDHTDWLMRHSYYTQVIEKRMIEKYMSKPSLPPSPREVAASKEMGIGKYHTIGQTEDKPLHRIPVVDE